MTTIIYDKKYNQIALDQRITLDGIITSDENNKVIINDIGVWFLSGSLKDYHEFSELNHNDKVKKRFDVSALLIRDGKVYLVAIAGNNLCYHLHLTYSDGVGSGCYFALSALDFGKTAKEAVEYAKTRDSHTGGKVRVFCAKTGCEIHEGGDQNIYTAMILPAKDEAEKARSEQQRFNVGDIS